jgi:hypothetical protein
MVAVVIAASIQFHTVVLVACAKHIVEIDPTIKESPRHVAHQCAQKCIDWHRM